MDPRSPFLEEANSTLGFADKEGSATLGKFEFGQDSVWFVGTNLLTQEKNSLSEPSRKLVFPTEYGSGEVYYKNWKWTIIKRGGNYALRLRDLSHPNLKEFTPTPTFDYNSTFRFPAKLIPRFNQTMDIPNVLGQVISWKVIGVLQFEY